MIGIIGKCLKQSRRDNYSLKMNGVNEWRNEPRNSNYKIRLLPIIPLHLHQQHLFTRMSAFPARNLVDVIVASIYQLIIFEFYFLIILFRKQGISFYFSLFFSPFLDSWSPILLNDITNFDGKWHCIAGWQNEKLKRNVKSCWTNISCGAQSLKFDNLIIIFI